MDRKVKLVNLTGHELFLTNNLDFQVVKSRGRARVKSQQEQIDRLHLGGDLFLPLLQITEQEVVGLPEEKGGVVYVVSGIVAAVANGQGRMDVVTPSRMEREKGNGRVMSARAVARIERK